MRKTRSTEGKGEKETPKGKPSESSSAKGYDTQADLQAPILGLTTLTKKVDSLVTDMTEIKKDKTTLKKHGQCRNMCES